MTHSTTFGPWFVQRTNRTAVAEYFGISWVTTGSIAACVTRKKLGGDRFENLSMIGVDEIYLHISLRRPEAPVFAPDDR